MINSHRAGAGLLADRRSGPAEFTRSALPDADPVVSDVEFAQWFAARGSQRTCEITEVPISELEGWHREPGSGNVVHDTGKFFSVQGVQVSDGVPPYDEVRRAIIVQPEIGVLGLLAKEFGGVLHVLVQAKTEPGSFSPVEIAPTVQATRSNYTRVHQGARTRYLEYFTDERRPQALVDVLQSEHGTYFYRKRNRNVVVLTGDDVEPHEDYCWLTLRQIRDLLRNDCVVNMNARTVLSCLAYATDDVRPGPEDESFRATLLRSTAGDRPQVPTGQVLSWFNHLKATREPTIRRVPLGELPDQDRDQPQIWPPGSPFGITGIAATLNSREVSSWMQPIISTGAPELIGLVVRRIDGVLHLLLRAAFEPGMRDVVEMAPTVQFQRGHGMPAAAHQEFAAFVLNAPPESVRYSCAQSEEGGRFLHAVNQYVIVEADGSFPVDVPPGYQWLTLAQAAALMQHGYYFTIQCRALIACLHTLW